MTIAVYNSFMLAHGIRGNAVAAERLFMEMKDKGITPNIVCYCTLINAYSKVMMYDRCWELFEEAKKLDIVDTITYTVMIKICALDFRPEKSIVLFKEMSEINPINYAYPYSAYISALATSDYYSEKAIEVWREMRYKGIIPEQHTFVFVLKAISRLGNLEYAKEALQEMKVHEISMNTDIYRYLLSTYSKAAIITNNREDIEFYEKESWKLLEQMEEKRIPVSIFCVNALLELYCNLGQVDKAEEIVLPLIGKYNVKANSSTYLTLMSEYLKNEQYSDVWLLFEKMQSKNIHLTSKIITCVFNSVIRNNDIDKIIQVFDKCKEVRIRPINHILVMLSKMKQVPDRVLLEISNYLPSVNLDPERRFLSEREKIEKVAMEIEDLKKSKKNIRLKKRIHPQKGIYAHRLDVE